MSEQQITYFYVVYTWTKSLQSGKGSVTATQGDCSDFMVGTAMKALKERFGYDTVIIWVWKSLTKEQYEDYVQRESEDEKPKPETVLKF